MSNGKSRAKGKRGELDVMHKLGGSAKRTGHAFSLAPDVCTKFGAYSIKNKTLGGGAILAVLHHQGRANLLDAVKIGHIDAGSSGLGAGMLFHVSPL